MPLELGLFLGCKRLGGEAPRKKACLILDRGRYRYRAFISDIAGQHIRAHNGTPRGVMTEGRDWLAAVSGRGRLPGGSVVAKLPGIAAASPAHSRSFDLSEMVEI